MIRVPVENLKSYCNPFQQSPWGSGEITMEDVETFIERRCFAKTPYPDVFDGWKHEVARIAYLTVHGWDDAIHLDVGVPALGCHVDWWCQDGNHRLAAAIYRGDEFIDADVCGDNGFMLEVLGVCYTDDVETPKEKFRKMGIEAGMQNDPIFQEMLTTA